MPTLDANSATLTRPRTRLTLLFLVALPVMASANAKDGFELARNLFRDAEDYATASALFADFIRNYPGDSHLAEARLMLARSYARSRRCGEAVTAYKEFYQRHPDDLSTAEARRERAACFEELGEHQRAGAAYEEIQHLHSASAFAGPVLLSAATAYTRGGDVDAARTVYARLLQEYTDASAARRGRYQLAKLHLASGDPAGAQLLLQHVIGSAPDSEETRDALLLAGRIHLFVGRAAEGAAAFSELRRRFGSSPHADTALVEVAADHVDRGRFAQAVDSYGNAVNRVRNLALKQRARLGHADALRRASRFADALEVYIALASELPTDSPVRASALLGEAVCLGRVGQPALAVARFFQLVQPTDELTAVNTGALRELGALYRRQGDLARAISWFRRYLEEAERRSDTFPEPAAWVQSTRLQLAQVYAAAGYFDEAVRLFSQLTRHAGALAAEAQYGLASAYEGSGARSLAVREYEVFLERFPGHRRVAMVRERVEYLREFTVSDTQGLNRALQQVLIDDLSGTSRRQVLYDLASALHAFQDYSNAVRTWETYTAAYVDDPSAMEARFYLADCLYRLARKREIEGTEMVADSLRAIAIQEDRLLASTEPASRWSRLAQLRLVEFTDSLESGYDAFLKQHPTSDENAPARQRALLGLGDARRRSASANGTGPSPAIDAYDQLLMEAGEASSPLTARARFGKALATLEGGSQSASIDSLNALLVQVPGSDLQPEVLFVLGRALRQSGRPQESAARLSELLLAFPAFDRRRAAKEELANAYLELGDFLRAADSFRHLADSDPAGDVQGGLRQRLARALAGQNDLRGALRVYDELLAAGASATDSLHFERGQLLRRLNRPTEAIESFHRIRNGPLAADAARHAADLLFADNQWNPALTAYALLADAEGADAELVARRVLCLFELGRVDEGRKAARQFDRRFDGTDVGNWPSLFRIHEARHLLQQRDYERALKILDDIGDKDTASAPVPVTDAPLLLRRIAADPWGAAAFYAATARWDQGRSEPSEEGIARALKAQSDFVSRHGASPFAPDVYLRLANFHFTIGRMLPAAGAYRSVVDASLATLEQKHDAVWKLLESYERLFEWTDAMRVARRIVDDFPGHPRIGELPLEIGYILKETGQYADAIAQLEKVLDELVGNDAAEARFYIGECYQNTGRYREAIQFFYSVSFHGNDASAGWINSADFERAACHEELDEAATARTIYERIIQREGNNSDYAKLAQRRIDQLNLTGAPPSPRGSE
ncbi:MAG: tetratricopeptide repeat protein [Candidatus Latescibacterota bacterium]|nr:tetratricopeptide repeat protein [Candidatus Latescibacterota bacterium]